MKTFFFLLAMTMVSFVGSAQERWTIQLNNDVLLQANKEDTSANVITIKDVKKGSLLVTYVSGKVENERKRKLVIMDATDKELYSKEASNLTIPASTLKKWRLTSPQIKIYTIPVLGEAGATVRLRPIHLVTIKFDWPYDMPEN